MSDSSSSSSSSHWTIEFFGPKLLATAETTSNDQQNSNPPKEVISSTRVISAIDDDDTRILYTTTKRSIVGLYFSASWCPPCKTFTPLLIDFYNVVNNENGLTDKKQQQQQTLEIVFVSSDREERSFTNYYTKMPWLAMLFDENQKRRNLTTMFKI
jgi:nucleoredoxin